MIYMKNSSLLIEIFGSYGNNEIHTFHRLAMMFGIYYARLNARNLTDHQGFSFEYFEDEMDKVANITSDYFERKAYLRNAK